MLTRYLQSQQLMATNSRRPDSHTVTFLPMSVWLARLPHMQEDKAMMESSKFHFQSESNDKIVQQRDKDEGEEVEQIGTTYPFAAHQI